MKFGVYDNYTKVTSYHDSLEEAEQEYKDTLEEYKGIRGLKVYILEVIEEN